jgi:hypothetical protein
MTNTGKWFTMASHSKEGGGLCLYTLFGEFGSGQDDHRQTWYLTLQRRTSRPNRAERPM